MSPSLFKLAARGSSISNVIYEFPWERVHQEENMTYYNNASLGNLLIRYGI